MPDQTGDSPECFIVEAGEAGERLDKLLAVHLPMHSRARLQDWIRAGLVQVDGQVLPPKARLAAGVQVSVQPPEPELDQGVQAQPIDFAIVYEDEALLVINKPAGLTVHPGAGQADGTLQNGLLHHRPALAALPRAGIVHRLDKDTTGLMVVAATLEAQTALSRAIQARGVQREYLALVWGVPVAGSTIEANLARHPRDRTRFAVSQGGREAVTHFRVEEKFPRHSLLRVVLETGRTHQIRVHMQHVGYPLVGDPVYGRRGDPYRRSFPRQALHAWRLAFAHPLSGEDLCFECEPPADMQALIEQLRGGDGVD